MTAFYLTILLTGMFMADLSQMPVLVVGSLRLLGIDLIDYAALALAALVFANGTWRRLSGPGRWYCAFLGWLALEVVLGATRYSASALGEFRYVAPLFWFFVPLALSELRRLDAWTEGGTLGLHAMGIAAAGAFVMFCIELASGGRVYLSARNQEVLTGFTDFRGVRYLDTYHTFNLMLGASIAIVQRTFGERASRQLLLAALLCLVALWTRNRAAIVAVAAALVIFGVLERRFRLLFSVGLASLTSVGVVMFLSERMSAQLTTAFAGVLNPATDETGAWRLLLQLDGIRQGLQTPLLGQGYGGYYRFELPGIAPILAPPHNQYIELFMKGGLVALALCLVSLWAFAMRLWRTRNVASLSVGESVLFRVVIIMLIALPFYGMAYDFPPLLGLLLGCTELILQRQRRRAQDDAAVLSHDPIASSGTPLPAPT